MKKPLFRLPPSPDPWQNRKNRRNSKLYHCRPSETTQPICTFNTWLDISVTKLVCLFQWFLKYFSLHSIGYNSCCPYFSRRRLLLFSSVFFFPHSRTNIRSTLFYAYRNISSWPKSFTRGERLFLCVCLYSKKHCFDKTIRNLKGERGIIIKGCRPCCLQEHYTIRAWLGHVIYIFFFPFQK